MGLKVAIVGLSPTTHNQAPFTDPEWECWGLPWDAGYWPYYSRLFEMHDIRLDAFAEDYIARLRDCGVPLYMQEAYEELGAIRYPFSSVARDIGRPYWNSSIAYAMALAIHEGAETIALYGVDMKADDEYGYQRPNMEYLIGVAVGRGIKVVIPEESPLCKFQQVGDHVSYVERYGWLG